MTQRHATPSPISVSTLRWRVAQLARPEVLLPLFDRIHQDEASLSRAAERSYAHQNGFAKIVLATGNGFKLRLHVWSPDGSGVSSAPAQENIHDHRWNFASAGLCGAIRNDFFAFTAGDAPTGDAPAGDVHAGEVERVHAHRYLRVDASTDYQLTYVGDRAVRRIRSLRVRAGESYGMGFTDLHRIVHDTGSLAATLVITAPPVSHECHLLSRSPMPLGETSGGRQLTPEEIVQMFQLVGGAL